MRNRAKASIVIVNYNGLPFLRDCLSSILKAISFDKTDHEVILVDNGSTDGSVDYVNRKFPKVRVLELGINMLVAEGYNAGVRIASNDIVILLQNDMVVKEDFIRPLIEHFEDGCRSNVFAVCTKQLRLDGRTLDGGRRMGKIFYGLFVPYGEHDNEKDIGQVDKLTQVLTAELGAAYNKEIFLKLGGFDPLFSYFYQGIDISYRAWKRGYCVLFEPRSVVYHMSGGTTKGIKKASRQMIDEKERLSFIFKNVTDGKYTIQSTVALPFYILLNICFKRFFILKSLILFLKAFPLIIAKRKQEVLYQRLSDTDVFKRVVTQNVSLTVRFSISAPHLNLEFLPKSNGDCSINAKRRLF